MDKYDNMNTDELSELLPDNLHLARNQHAAADDRWRVFNSMNGEYVAPGFGTMLELLRYVLRRIEKSRAEWVNFTPVNSLRGGRG